MTGSRPAEHRVDPDVDAAGVDGPLVSVQLLDLPVAAFAAAQQHSNELMRELTHVANQVAATGSSRRTGATDPSHPSREIPVRLVAIVEELNTGYRGFTLEQDQQLAGAVAAGSETIPELTYRVPASAADAARHLSAMLDEADDYCRDGQHLLTLATPPDLVAFRRWYLGEFQHQISGRAPTSWPRYRELVGR